MSHISDPPFLVVENPDKSHLYKISLKCLLGYLSGVFVWKVWSGVVFVRPHLLSEYICYNRKLHITFSFRFHMYDRNFLSVTSHALYDPSLCHKLSHLLRLHYPSSVMYFMDGAFDSF